jgi:hypothetical protein
MLADGREFGRPTGCQSAMGEMGGMASDPDGQPCLWGGDLQGGSLVGDHLIGGGR